MEQMIKVYKGFGANKAFQREAEKLSKSGWFVASQSSAYVHHAFSVRPKHLEISVTYRRN